MPNACCPFLFQKLSADWKGKHNPEEMAEEHAGSEGSPGPLPEQGQGEQEPSLLCGCCSSFTDHSKCERAPKNGVGESPHFQKGERFGSCRLHTCRCEGGRSKSDSLCPLEIGAHVTEELQGSTQNK